MQEIPFERLHLDTEGKFGQVRVLDMEKVKVIYNNLMVRKPALLDLVTTLSLTGSPLSLLPHLPGCPDIEAAFSPGRETMSLPYGRHCHTDMSGIMSQIWSHSWHVSSSPGREASCFLPHACVNSHSEGSLVPSHCR